MLDNKKINDKAVLVTEKHLNFVTDHIIEFFFQNSYFSSKQYGFIKGRSTVLQLLKIMDDWTAQLDSGGQVDVIYTD